MSSITLDEILGFISEYRASPDTEQLKNILAAVSALDTLVEQEAALRELAKEKDKHGMSLTVLRQQVKDFRKEVTAEDADAFFNDGRFVPARVADALQAESHFLNLPIDEKLRVYSDGVYREDRTGETWKIVDGWLGDASRPDRMSTVLELLKGRSKQDVDRHVGWINFANGRWCLESWKLLEHSPAYPSIVQLPVLYNPDAKCPEFDKWLVDVLPAEDDQFLLLQLMGYSMLQDVRFGKIAVLYGPTHTGKSTCLELLKAFLGWENVSALTLHALDNEERRFSRSGLVGKLANLSADLSSKYLAGDSQIKQIAVGDPMQVEFKGIQSFAYSPFATLWASANQLPVSHDRTDAWYERLVILPFFSQHKGKAADRKLLEKLTQPSELSGILNRVLEALQVLLSKGVFITTDATVEMLEQYKRENDHVDRFLSETYERVATVELLEDDVFEDYKRWCEDEGIKALSKTKFREGVKAWGCPRKRKNESGSRYFVFQGIQKL